MAAHPETQTVPKPHRTGHQTGHTFTPTPRPAPKQPGKPKYT